MQKSKAKARFEVKMSLLCKESLHAALPCHQVTIFRHRGVELRRESAGDFTFFCANVVRRALQDGGKRQTCIHGNNFGRSRRVMDFDWGASIVIVFCVISRAAVQMSVFTHKWSETSPLWTNTYLLFPEIIKKHFINVCCKRFSFWQASHFTLRCFISTKSQAKHNMYSNL